MFSASNLALYSLSLEQRGVSLVVNLFKDVFESSVIFLEDRILRAHIQRPLLAECILEATVSKANDRLR